MNSTNTQLTAALAGAALLGTPASPAAHATHAVALASATNNDPWD